MLGGCLANRADSVLCMGTNKLYKRILDRIEEPANHHIQRAIRKSYLQACYVATKFVLTEHSAWEIKSKNKLNKIKRYVEKEISRVHKDDTYIPDSVLDTEYRELLFPKEESSAARKSEIILKLKQSIIEEIEGKGYEVPAILQKVIHEGWKEKERSFDFYALICAFFTQELKTNTNVARLIQTEYLDHIQMDTEALRIETADLKEQINVHFETYGEILPKLDLLLDGVDQLKDGQQNLQNQLEDLPQKTAEIVLQGLERNYISHAKEVTLSKQYTSQLGQIEGFKTQLDALKAQKIGLETAMQQVDETTKSVLSQSLANVEQQIHEAFEKKKAAENELNEFIANVIALAKQLKESNTMESSRLSKAKELFANGDYERLEEVLNEQEIDQEIAAFKAKANALANELTLKAQASLVNRSDNWYERTERLYKKALGIVENFNTTYNYAGFLATNKQNSTALSLYERALNHCDTEEQRAEILYGLGRMYRAIHESGKSEEMLSEALKITTKLAEVEEKKFLPEVLRINISLGALLRNTQRYEEAQERLNEAIYRIDCLKDGRAKSYLAQKANALNILGHIKVLMKSFSEGKSYFESSLEIYDELYAIDRNKYGSLRAIVLGNLGAALQYLKNFEASKAAYKEALAIHQKFYSANERAFGPNAAVVLKILGGLYLETREFTKAEKFLTDALTIYKQLMVSNPETHKISYCEHVGLMGNLFLELKDYEKSEKYLREAIELQRTQLDTNSSLIQEELAYNLTDLGRLYREKEDLDLAESTLSEALEIRTKLSQDFPDKHLMVTAETLDELGILFHKKQNLQQAEALLLESLRIKNEVNEQQAKIYQADVANTKIQLGKVYQELQESKIKSTEMIEEAIATLQSLPDNPGNRQQLELAYSLLHDEGPIP